MKNLFNSIDKVYVINLKKDSARRLHVDKQFKKQITYEFVYAVSHNDNEVKEMYIDNKVALIHLVLGVKKNFVIMKTITWHQNKLPIFCHLIRFSN